MQAYIGSGPKPGTQWISKKPCIQTTVCSSQRDLKRYLLSGFRPQSPQKQSNPSTAALRLARGMLLWLPSRICWMTQKVQKSFLAPGARAYCHQATCSFFIFLQNPFWGFYMVLPDYVLYIILSKVGESGPQLWGTIIPPCWTCCSSRIPSPWVKNMGWAARGVDWQANNANICPWIMSVLLTSLNEV